MSLVVLSYPCHILVITKFKKDIPGIYQSVPNLKKICQTSKKCTRYIPSVSFLVWNCMFMFLSYAVHIPPALGAVCLGSTDVGTSWYASKCQGSQCLPCTLQRSLPASHYAQQYLVVVLSVRRLLVVLIVLSIMMLTAGSAKAVIAAALINHDCSGIGIHGHSAR